MARCQRFAGPRAIAAFRRSAAASRAPSTAGLRFGSDRRNTLAQAEPTCLGSGPLV